jgi:Acetyltransferase (isoleucine patch superfamily)
MKNFSGLSSRCVIYAETDDYSGESLTNPMVLSQYRKVTGGQVILERHVIIGTGTSILPDVLIGEGTAVGSMSLVNRSLESWGIYAGSPCKKIKERKRNLLEMEKSILNYGQI